MVFERFKALFPRNFLLHINNLPENVTIALLDSGIIFQRTSGSSSYSPIDCIAAVMLLPIHDNAPAL